MAKATRSLSPKQIQERIQQHRQAVDDAGANASQESNQGSTVITGCSAHSSHAQGHQRSG